MSTTYINTVPNPNDPPNQDVQNMQNNAMAIYNIWNKDHYTFNTANPGLHSQVTFPVAVSQSTPASGAGVLYTQLVSGLAQLFFKNASTTTQLTGVSSLLIRAGVSSMGSGVTTVNVTYTAFPTATIAFVVSPFSSYTIFNTSNPSSSASSNSVSRSSGAGTAAFSWIAIGN